MKNFQTFKTTQGTISYYLNSQNKGPTIIFLPSFGGDSAYYNYKHVIEALQGTFNVLTLDMFGYGFSDNTTDPRTLENFQQELSQIVTHLKIQQIIWVVHSLAGSKALYYTSNHPEQVLAFISIEPTTFEATQLYQDEFTPYIELAPKVREMIAKGQSNDLSLKNSVNPTLSEEEKQLNIQVLEKKIFNPTLINEAKQAIDNLELTTKISLDDSIPTLLFTQKKRVGEFTESVYVTQHIASEIVTMGDGHYIHWQEPLKFNQILRSFLGVITLN